MKTIVGDNWYENFFEGLNSELWQKAANPIWTNQETDFIVNVLKLEKGCHLLDIPCGFGRHAVKLAQRGFTVTGVDISPTFINALTEKTITEKLSVIAINANILTIELDQKFDGAICMGNSFGYFNFDKMKFFIQNVSSSLKKGAKFIIHSGMLAESVLPAFSTHRMYDVEDIKMSISNEYDEGSSCITSHISYTKHFRKEEHSFKHYVFTLHEIKRLLKMYGLNTIHTYSTTSKNEYRLGSEQIYIVAEKL